MGKTYNDRKFVGVTIILGRQLLGVVLNVIIPTIVLNAISYSTNFYRDDHFETIIAINLTTMLVIVTLFVSVSEGLPATSYIKMIDVWLLFNLVIPFTLIMIQTWMDSLRKDMEYEEKEPDDNKSVSNNSIRSNPGRRQRFASGDSKSKNPVPPSTIQMQMTEFSKWGNIEAPPKYTKNAKRYKILRHIAIVFIPIF